MAEIERMTKEQMRNQTEALHVDYRDGVLYVWGVVSQTVCLYNDRIHMGDPEAPEPSGTIIWDAPKGDET